MPHEDQRAPGDSSSELVVLGGAGDRDRTGMTSLEGWGSTIELRPRSGLAGTQQRTVYGREQYPRLNQPRAEARAPSLVSRTG
jgi:hypothetical protein